MTLALALLLGAHAQPFPLELAFDFCPGATLDVAHLTEQCDGQGHALLRLHRDGAVDACEPGIATVLGTGVWQRRGSTITLDFTTGGGLVIYRGFVQAGLRAGGVGIVPGSPLGSYTRTWDARPVQAGSFEACGA